MTLRKWALAERNEIESQICKGWVEGKGQLMQLAPLSASPLRFMFCCIGSRQTLRASNTSLRHAKVLLGQRTQRWELASPLKPRAPGTRTMAYLSYDYEVFGKVQGVFFRSSTVDEAKKLGVVGWVKNTSAGTVQGQAQGKPDAAGKLKTFLKEVGSPSSHIDKCIISNEKNVEKLEFSGFEER